MDDGSYSVIDTANKYGYEWGEYGTTGITASDIGTGLSNTNSLIAMNLQPDTSGWYMVWDKIKEFRQSHSDNWFLPSKYELYSIYEARSNLSNLSTITNRYYQSSSEHSDPYVWSQNFRIGGLSGQFKNSHVLRSRLCVQFTQADID